MFLHLIHGSVADPGQYSTDPGPADVKKTDPDPVHRLHSKKEKLPFGFGTCVFGDVRLAVLLRC